MPRSLRQANDLGRQIVATQTAALAHLREAHSQNMMALNRDRQSAVFAAIHRSHGVRGIV
jgi:hypothetical protein